MKLKPIILLVHAMGVVVATLVTLWVLEKRLYLEKRLRQSSPFCIKFGKTLVGDVGLGEVVARENWVGNFYHVVSKYDVIP